MSASSLASIFKQAPRQAVPAFSRETGNLLFFGSFSLNGKAVHLTVQRFFGSQNGFLLIFSKKTR
jgi:hypothetical protein